ncbi:MAG: DUF547 domain-containing protein [Xanthomarina gelatinilytica]|uniref:DUF547 domain-containing protein n=1 Tax=Xanthomarina gelatinilytica TaxID=1137281 RepID=UPI003A87121F
MKTKAYILIVLLAVSLPTKAQNPNDHAYNKLLQKHVNSFGEVNYQAIKTDPQVLQASLEGFTKTQPDKSWSQEERLVYWINAYNAFTIKLIIDHYPIKSIKDIKNPWDRKFIPIGKNLRSLNEIEHNILRNMKEPRIHFAIVCASKSCPKLWNKAYTASELDLQLTLATEAFLSDNTKNKLAANNIQISKIFKWFSEDFTTNGNLIDFLNLYAPIEISQKAKKSYMDYNWDLNE